MALVIVPVNSVFAHALKEILGLTHKVCVLQRLSFDAPSDVTVVHEMRQRIYELPFMKQDQNNVVNMKFYHSSYIEKFYSSALPT